MMYIHNVTTMYYYVQLRKNEIATTDLISSHPGFKVDLYNHHGETSSIHTASQSRTFDLTAPP